MLNSYYDIRKIPICLVRNLYEKFIYSECYYTIVEKNYWVIRMVGKDEVLKAMKEAGKPVKPGDVAKALGVDSKEVSKVIKELKKEGKVISPKRCYYAPAE